MTSRKNFLKELTENYAKNTNELNIYLNEINNTLAMNNICPEKSYGILEELKKNLVILNKQLEVTKNEIINISRLMPSSQSQKHILKLIAYRYGLGYIVSEHSVCLTPSYLPNHPEIDTQPAQGLVWWHKLSYGLRHLAISSNGASMHPEYQIPLCYYHPEDTLISEIDVRKTIQKMDQQFVPVNKDKTIEKMLNRTNDSYSRVNRKNPIEDKVTRRGPCTISIYFASPQLLELFLQSIPDEDKNKSKKHLPYGIYQCTFGYGCYQIFIFKGHELDACTLLLEKNKYTKNLPITQYILRCLQPKPFLSSLGTASISDEQLSIAITFILKCFENQANFSFEYLNLPLENSLEQATSLKKAMLDTVVYFNNHCYEIKSCNNFFPSVITKIITDYSRDMSENEILEFKLK
ncbi:MAG: hypothetical protein JO131_07345 [Gammaproteobacteria bacterium]|nr:hypothetical protein [Gammaproteobacteria bacterium]